MPSQELCRHHKSLLKFCVHLSHSVDVGANREVIFIIHLGLINEELDSVEIHIFVEQVIREKLQSFVWGDPDAVKLGQSPSQSLDRSTDMLDLT